MPDERQPETDARRRHCRRCGAVLRARDINENCVRCAMAISAGNDDELNDGTIDSDLRCARCGNTLIGVDTDGNCRRCELPVKQPLSAGRWKSAVDAHGAVESDTACRKCGYNLRGLPESGNCPECGTAVALSIRGDYLCYADPAWSRKIARGSVWISRGMISTAASLTVGCCFSLGLAAGGSALVLIPFAIGVIAFLGGFLLQYIGTWIITTPDPALPPHASGVTARKLIRIGLFLSIVEVSVEAIVESTGAPPLVWITIAVVGVPMSVISVIATVAYFGYLAKLTARIPNDVLTRRAVSLKMWAGLGVGIVLLVITTESLYETFVSSANVRPDLLNAFSVCSGLIGGLILLISAVRTIRLQWQFATAAREQAARAEANWHSSDGSPVGETQA